MSNDVERLIFYLFALRHGTLSPLLRKMNQKLLILSDLTSQAFLCFKILFYF